MRKPWAVLSFILMISCLSGCTSRTMAARFAEEPTISLFMHETGQTRHMPHEEYVKGVVAKEMDPTWPEEALGAQAILARTFTIQRMMRGKTRHGTDASTDPAEFQAYDATRINERVSKAVEDTRGKVATHRGSPIQAYFHSCSGGVTANAREGLNTRATRYLAGMVRDRPCPNPDVQEWSASFSVAEVAAAMRSVGARPRAITSASIARRGPSGRATQLRMGGRTVNAPEFRLALDPARMKSTLLTSIRVGGGRVIMEGRGWGHGVGMSQWGARMRAEDGQTAEEIIQTYYQDIQISRLYE